MLYIIFDVIVAGSNATTYTMQWSLLYMICHPDIQSQVQQEIDSVLSSTGDGTINLSHRPLMPYTEATLMEVQRHCCFFPLGLPHCTTKDVELEGCIIPSDTMVSPSVICTLRCNSFREN